MHFSLPDFDVGATEPDWLAARFDEIAAHVKANKADTSDVELDQPVNIGRATTRLRMIAPAIQDAGGDAQMYTVFCEMRDLGLTKETAIDLVQEHYIPRCTPATAGYEWLDLKASNAYYYGQSSIGCDAVKPSSEAFADFMTTYKAKADEALAAYADELEGVDMVDLVAVDPGPVECLIGSDIMEKGITCLLKGHGGGHKSRICLQTGIQMAHGLPITVWGDRVPAHGIHTVYLSSEDDNKEINRRMRGMCQELKIKPERGRVTCIGRKGMPSYLTMMEEGGAHTESDFYHALVERLKRIPGHKLVVLDSLLDFVAFVGRAKIDEAAVNTLFKVVLEGICRECDCTIYAIFHTSNAGKMTGDGWSVAFHNAPREAHLTLVDEDGSITFSKVKHNHTPPVQPQHLIYKGGALVPYGKDASPETRALIHAAVAVAREAAETGLPIQKGINAAIPDWVFDHVEKATGRRPVKRELRQALYDAMNLKLVRYVTAGTSKLPAGFYARDDVPAPIAEQSEDNGEAASGGP